MTFRELFCLNNWKDESYDAWLDRLRAENRESERQHKLAMEQAHREQIAEDIRTGHSTFYDMSDEDC